MKGSSIWKLSGFRLMFSNGQLCGSCSIPFPCSWCVHYDEAVWPDGLAHFPAATYSSALRISCCAASTTSCAAAGASMVMKLFGSSYYYLSSSTTHQPSVPSSQGRNTDISWWIQNLLSSYNLTSSFETGGVVKYLHLIFWWVEYFFKEIFSPHIFMGANRTRSSANFGPTIRVPIYQGHNSLNIFH